MTIYEKSFGKWIRFTMSDRSVLIRAWNTRISGIRKITIYRFNTLQAFFEAQNQDYIYPFL